MSKLICVTLRGIVYKVVNGSMVWKERRKEDVLVERVCLSILHLTFTQSTRHTFLLSACPNSYIKLKSNCGEGEWVFLLRKTKFLSL